MPKLLIVTTVASTLRAFLLPYARHFRKKGWTVDAMSNGVSGCEQCGKAFDRCHEIPFSRNPLNLKNFRGIHSKIGEVVLEGKYDIIHVHTPVASFVTRLALSKCFSPSLPSPPPMRCPKVVYTAHGFHFYKGGGIVGDALFSAMERAAGNWTDHTIAINQEDYDAALAYQIADEEHLSLLPGVGLDFNVYSPKAVQVSAIKKFHESLNLAKGDELFLMVAEFNAGKRHRDAIRALAETGRKDFHLAFAGTGPLENAMKKLASKLRVDSRVHFLGQRADVPLLMLSSRATILPSEREGLNRSVMESICLGIPVLGADVRGIRDLITTPERGALFPVGRPAALAAAMILAVEDPCETKPTPDPLWSIEHLLSEHEKIYRKLFTRT
ncbi:MAG: glycosyltransferase [Synergistaceae bacterium]|jgi:glycosyltransferase involved in cell wall biosynthesis|nr:glycosyltransferase [Synergistaceae bacterium]